MLGLEQCAGGSGVVNDAQGSFELLRLAGAEGSAGRGVTAGVAYLVLLALILWGAPWILRVLFCCARRCCCHSLIVVVVITGSL